MAPERLRLTVRLAFINPENWTFLLGVYRYESTATLCLILVSVSVEW